MAEELLGSGYLDGLVRHLQRKYPNFSEEASGAVALGVRKLITRAGSVDEPERYVAVVAYNEMKRLGRERARALSLDAFRETDQEDPRLTADTCEVDEELLLQETYGEIKKYIETWESGSVRATVLL